MGIRTSVRAGDRAFLQGENKFKSTKDIIRAAEQGLLPDQIMITIHPQRWTNKPLPWVKELVWQNIKNVAKGILVKTKKRKTP